MLKLKILVKLRWLSLLLTQYIFLGVGASAQTIDLPIGIMPNISVFPSGNYVVAYRSIAHTLDILEFDSGNNLLNQFNVFNSSDSGTISVLYPKIIYTGLDTTGRESYFVSAWTEAKSPNYSLGIKYTIRQFGVSAPVVPPKDAVGGYVYDGTTISSDGQIVYSSAHCQPAGWDICYGIYEATTGNQIDSGIANTTRTNAQYSPKVAAIGNGSTFFTAWFDCSLSTTEGEASGSYCVPSEVKARVYEPGYNNVELGGHFWGPEFLGNITSQGNQGTAAGTWGRHENQTFSIAPFQYDPLTNVGRVLLIYLTDHFQSPLTNVAAAGVIYEYNTNTKTITPVTDIGINGEFLIASSNTGSVNFINAQRLNNGSVLVVYTKDQDGTTALFSKVINSSGLVIQEDTIVRSNVGTTADAVQGDVGAYAFPQIGQVNSTSAKVVWQENAYATYDDYTWTANQKIMDFSIGTSNVDNVTVQ